MHLNLTSTQFNKQDMSIQLEDLKSKEYTLQTDRTDL